MGRLRLALTISGAVSLGAYEAGALAALLVAVQHLLQEPEQPVQVDAIAGASAGAITGLLATRILLEGLDPVRVLHRAWVEEASLSGLLRGGGWEAPLSARRLHALASELLEGRRRPGTAQAAPVSLQMALANLHGSRYSVATLCGDGRGRVDAQTYLDWGGFIFSSGDPVAAYTEPAGVSSAVDVALASAANPLGFAPKLLNRKVRPPHHDDRLDGRPGPGSGPGHGWFWYTDGGTLDNQPLGRTVELVTAIDGGEGPYARRRDDEDRLIVLVQSFPGTVQQASAWTDAARLPGWTDTLLRAQNLQRTQTIYDDLRRLQEVNSRALYHGVLVDRLERLVAGLDAGQREEWVRELQQVVAFFEDDMSDVCDIEGRPEPWPRASGADDPLLLLRLAIERVAGLTGKTAVGVEVISPTPLLARLGVTQVEQLLAGEFLFRFGGFVDEKLRRSDFDLGYLSTLTWLESGGLRGTRPDRGLDDERIAAAVRAVRRRHAPVPVVERTLRGRPLSIRARLGLARIAGRVAGVLVRERVLRRRTPHDPPPLPGPDTATTRS